MQHVTSLLEGIQANTKFTLFEFGEKGQAPAQENSQTASAFSPGGAKPLLQVKQDTGAGLRRKGAQHSSSPVHQPIGIARPGRPEPVQTETSVASRPHRPHLPATPGDSPIGNRPHRASLTPTPVDSPISSARNGPDRDGLTKHSSGLPPTLVDSPISSGRSGRDRDGLTKQPSWRSIAAPLRGDAPARFQKGGKRVGWQDQIDLTSPGSRPAEQEQVKYPSVELSPADEYRREKLRRQHMATLEFVGQATQAAQEARNLRTRLPSPHSGRTGDPSPQLTTPSPHVPKLDPNFRLNDGFSITL